MHQNSSAVLEALRAYECLVNRIIMKNRQDFTKTQVEVMLVLEHAGQINMTRLSEFVGVSKEQASRATAPLAEAGLVEKHRNPASQREIEIALTEEGRRKLGEVTALHKRDLSKLLDQADPADVNRLSEVSQEASELLWRILRSAK